jgi:hypothetical protein
MKITNKVIYAILALVLIFGLTAMAFPESVQAADNGSVFANEDGAYTLANAAITPTAYTGTPKVKVMGVVINKTASFEGTDFPANTKFNVYIGPYHDFTAKSVLVGKVNSGKGKIFHFSVKLPKIVRQVDLVGVRLVSASGYYAFNFFINDPNGSSFVPTPTPSHPTPNKCTIVSTNPSVVVKTNSTFAAKWVVKNTGAREWSMYVIDFKFVSGRSLHTGASAYDMSKTVKPGETITLTVSMKAPSGVGTFTTNWALGNKKITVCALPLTIKVEK